MSHLLFIPKYLFSHGRVRSSNPTVMISSQWVASSDVFFMDHSLPLPCYAAGSPRAKCFLLNFTNCKKYLDISAKYDWNLIKRLDIFHWNLCSYHPVLKSNKNYQLWSEFVNLWIQIFFILYKTWIFHKGQ